MLTVSSIPYQFTMMDAAAPNPVKSPGFMDKLGQHDSQKEKRRAELIEEYERFKIMDEERFRNRFADKKNRVRETNEYVGSTIPSSPAQLALYENRTEGDKPEIKDAPILDDRINNKLQQIMQKIEALQAMKSSTGSIDTESHARVSEHKPPTLSNEEFKQQQSRLYENILDERLRNLQAAEQKLAALEREYNLTKTTLMKQSAEPTVHAGFHMLSLPAGASTITSPLEIPSADREKRLGQQEQYRQALELQFTDGRRIECDENQMNLVKDKPSEFASFSMGYTPDRSGLDERKSLEREQRYVHIEAQRPLEDEAASKKMLESPKSTPTEVDTERKRIDEERAKKAKYAQDLREQIEEANRRKALQKKLDQEYERKIEEEYLRQQSKDNTQESIPAVDSKLTGAQNKSEEIDQNSFARGGHGIFGEPLSSDQKTANQKYKEELAKQIEDKRAREAEQRRKQQEEEEREEKRLAAEQERLRIMYEKDESRIKSIPKEVETLLQDKFEDQQPKIENQNHEPKHPRAATKREKPEEKTHHGQTECVSLIRPITSESPDRRPKDNQEQRKDETSRIINQLNNLRSQVECEKTRIEEIMRHQDVPRDWYQDAKPGSPFDMERRKPKLSKKAVHLFGEPSRTSHQPVTSHASIPISIETERTSLQRSADMKFQHSYLRTLDEELKKLGNRERMTDLELQRQKAILPSLVQQGHMINETPSESVLLRSPSEMSLDLVKLQEENRKRLKRLQVYQQHSPSESDPEVMLDNFIQKCDSYREG